MTQQSDVDGAPAGDDSRSSFGAGVEGSSADTATTTPRRKSRRSKKKAPSATSASAEADGSPAEADPGGDPGGDPGEDRPARKRSRRPRRKKAATAEDSTSEDAESPDEGRDDPSGERKSRRRRGSRGGRRRKRAGEDGEAATVDVIPGEDDQLDQDGDDGGGDDVDGRSPRSKKAGRRGRRRSAARKATDPDDDAEESDDSPAADEGGGRKKRRRRRSRRKSSEAEDAPDDDPDADLDDDAEASRGRRGRKTKTTKKAAKKKATRKTAEERAREAEALRTQTIAVNAVEPEERRVAVYEGDRIVDFLMNAESQKTLVNDIYRGRVVNLEPAIGAAFIDFGQGRNGFLHTSDVMPLYGEDGFKLSDLLTAGIHHVEGDHDAEWSEEADALDDDVADEIADIDDLEDDDVDDLDDEDHEDDDEDDDQEDADEEDDREDASDALEEVGDDDSEDDSDGDSDPEASAGDDPGDAADVEDEAHDATAEADEPDAPDGDVDPFESDGSDDDDEEREDEEEEEEAHEADDSFTERILRLRAARPVSPHDAVASGDGGGSDDGGAADRPARKRRPRRAAAKSDADGDDAPARKRSSRKKASAKSAKDDDGAPARKSRSKKKASRSAKADDAQSDDGGKAKKSASRKKDKKDKKDSTRKKSARKSEARSGKKKKAGKKASGRKKTARGRKNVGGRPRRGRGDRRPQRERRPIDQLLKVGDPVVVQVTKDAIGDKGPTLTTYVSMPGRYLVLMPSMARTGVSRKIPDDKERKRLKRILASMNTPPDMGVIVRTAGVGRTKTDLQRDLDYLMGLWESFGKKLDASRGPAPLYLESDVATRTLRDLFDRQTKEVIVDDFTVHDQMVTFAKELMPEHVDRIKRHEGDRPLFQHCGIEQDFERIFARRVDLPSGGSIVFDQAEALVAIDVNSGRTRTDSYDFEEIALKTNLEAVPEIARQIKLRDLGGIIVCDFIDMVRSSSNRQVEKRLREELAGDRARSKLSRISQFGLLEMTRQRLGPGTHKKVFQACPRCRGTGRVRTVESRAQAILRRLGGAVVQKGFSKVEVRAHPEVVDYLKEELWDWVRAMEHRSEKEISLTAVPDQPEDSVLRYLRADGREVRPGGRRKR